MLLTKCEAFSGSNPALTMSVSLNGNVVLPGAPHLASGSGTVSGELGIGVDSHGNRKCFVAGCAGSGGAYPPQVPSVSGGFGLSMTIEKDASEIPGTDAFVAFAGEVRVPTPFGAVKLSPDVTFSFEPGQGMQDVSAVSFGFGLGGGSHTPYPTVSLSATSGFCYTPICAETSGDRCGAPSRAEAVHIEGPKKSESRSGGVVWLSPPAGAPINRTAFEVFSAQVNQRRVDVMQQQAQLLAASPDGEASSA